ncbi:MAG TPA: hypothetical protein DCZ95_07470 [Verrucomicrobia bacterium]|nr:MAG: hypothetical protein A2X46_16355 [Lentisphaerae bacterium GWF2_57_35]HBA83914.1 hypothetical protein [Verrucomicrobiota bacterium]
MIPWICLSYFRFSKLPLADWRRHLLGVSKPLQAYLAKCLGEIAGTLPCPQSGQRLRVVRRGEQFIAIPEEGFETDAEELRKLTLKDVQLWTLDMPRLEREIAVALGLIPQVVESSDRFTLIGIAGVSESRKPVFLAYAANAEESITLCAEVVRHNPRKCAVILPVYDQPSEEFLRRHEAELIVLEESVSLTVDGIVASSRPAPVRDTNAVLLVDVINDYKILRLPNGREIDLSKKHKCRAFVRYLHERRKKTSNRIFYYDEERQNFNESQSVMAIDGSEFKYGLFRNLTKDFDILFTTLDSASDKYQINF